MSHSALLLLLLNDKQAMPLRILNAAAKYFICFSRNESLIIFSIDNVGMSKIKC